VRVRSGNFLQRRFDTCEFISQHGLEQIEFTRKVRIERFLANPELRRQIVHRYAAKSMTKEMRPRRIDDLLSIGIGPPLFCHFHRAVQNVNSGN